MYPRRVLLLIGFCLMALVPTPSQGQTIQLDLRQVSLDEALAQLRAQADIDIVYAQRLVADQRATCQYKGTSRADALACVLGGSSLEAQRVRRGQYVLVRAQPSGATPARPPRTSLTGFVTDAQTGEALPGAHIYLTDLQVGATTNSVGYFAFSSIPSGAYPAQISYLGFEPLDTTLVAADSALRLALRPSTLEADGVVVEAGIDEPEQSGRMPGMLSAELGQMSRMPALSEQDLFQALQWSPGIRKTSPLNGGLSVRGAKPDQNLYLLDGAPIYHPWHAFSLISVFQTGTLKNTQFYRGAFPAEYGGRLASVLDAQMRDGNRATPKAEVAISALSGRFRVESPLTSSVSFMLSGRRSYIDKLIGEEHPVQDAGGRRDTLRTGYYFYDSSAKLSARLSDQHRFSLSFYQGRDDLDLRLPFDLSLDFSSWLRPADLFFEVQQNWQNRVVSGQHRYLASDRLFVTSTGYYSGYSAQEASFVQPTTAASLSSDYNVRLHDVGLKVDADYYHSVAHRVRVGAQVTRQRFWSTLNSDLRRSPGAVEAQNQESQLRALKLVGYVQDTWKPSPRWEVQPGVRLSYFSSGRYAHIRPRLSANYTVHPDYLVVRGAVGAHVQYLHRLRDRFSVAYDLVSSRWVPSSTRVKPSSGVQASFGAQSNPLPGMTVELSTYGRLAKDVLVPEDAFRTKDGLEGPGIQVGALLGQYATARQRAYGAELSLRFERGPWRVQVAGASGRSLVRAPSLGEIDYRSTDLDVPYSFRSAVSWRGGPWQATLASELRSGYPESVPTARYALGDPIDDDAVTYLYRPQANNGRLPAYARLDATLSYRFTFLDAQWTTKAGVYNLANRRNVVSRQYAPTDTGVDVSARQGLPVLPILEMEVKL